MIQLDPQEMIAISPDGQTLIIGNPNDYWNDFTTLHLPMGGKSAVEIIEGYPQKMRVLDDEGMFPST